MLISSLPPPPKLGSASEFCRPCGKTGPCMEGVRGLSGDPFGITDALTAISNVWVAKKQSDTNKKYVALENKKLQAENQAAQVAIAQQQADELVAPYKEARLIQMAALGAVAVVGGAIAMMFLKAALAKEGNASGQSA